MLMKRKSEPNILSGSPEIAVNQLLEEFQKYALLHEYGATSYDLASPPVIARTVLDRLKDKVDDIAPLPEIWHKVQDILNDPASSPSDLGRIVAQDPILSARLLQICSSSAFKSPSAKPVSNVTLAIARLGMAQASTFILESVVPNLGGSSRLAKSESRHIWFHSLAISLICRSLAEPSKIIDGNEIGMFGLLHDIGKLVVLHVEGEIILRQLADAIESGVPALKAESEILGYTHIDAGMMLALHWKLPKDVSDLILFHHHPCAFVPGQWPRDMMVAIMLVHTAHIVLQGGILGEQERSIWSPCQRTHVDGLEELLHEPLQITRNYAHIFSSSERELDKLRLMFPDVFPRDKQV